MRCLAAVLLVVAGNAHAAPPPTTAVTQVLETVASGGVPSTMRLPRFAITVNDVDASPGDWGSLIYGASPPTGSLEKPITGVSADGTAGWAAGEITPAPCIRGAMPDDTTGDSSYFEGERCKWEQRGAFARGALVAELDGTAWQPVAWHIYGQAPGYVGPATTRDLEAHVAAGAEDAAKLFAATIADPRALAKTLSRRADVLMFGSAKGERFIGAKQIGAQLAKWSLSFKVQGGAIAGIAGKSVAWVAANVSARSLKKPKAKPTYYRVLMVYEHAGDSWQLVQASFSDLAPPP